MLDSEADGEDSGSDDRISSCSSPRAESQESTHLLGLVDGPRPRLGKAYAKSDTEQEVRAHPTPTEEDGYNSSRGYPASKHIWYDYVVVSDPQYTLRSQTKELFQKAQSYIGPSLRKNTRWRASRRDPC